MILKESVSLLQLAGIGLILADITMTNVKGSKVI